LTLPYWFVDTLRALPAAMWMFVGLGLPYALATLPRREWRSRPLVAMIALALGPALMTAWLFVLGTIGGAGGEALLTPAPILIGSAVLCVVGVLLVLWKRRRPMPMLMTTHKPLAFDERFIIGMIIAAVIIRWLTTAYWNFTEYDPLWVYGYEGRLYTLKGFIPPSIGYYPQFVPLQYAYSQILAVPLTNGLINDHVARVVVPFWHLGSILAAYILGQRLFNRRVGIFAAGLWALYHHVGMWSHAGDLEIPLTFAFTGAAAFFLSAWIGTPYTDLRYRLHTAAIGGLFLGIALWTKPTAGAFILGVLLLVAFEAARLSIITPHDGGKVRVWLRGIWKALAPRFWVAFVTGLACMPLGGLWYIRNLVYGHEPITLPNSFWVTQALQSGAEFGWLLLAGALVIGFVSLASFRDRPNVERPNRWRLVVAMLLIAGGILPTLISPYNEFNLPQRMGWIEWLLVLAGTVLAGMELSPWGSRYLAPSARWDLNKVAWTLLLALPYFITWFISYSYHYRLSFAIVPLLILPSAVLLAHWTQRIMRWSPNPRKLAYQLVLIALLVPGVFSSLHQYRGGWDWLWSNEFPDDFSKLLVTNEALAWTVRVLQDDITAQNLVDPVIVAPGLQRLPFFFPLAEVRNETAPTTLAEVADADYYLYTQEAAWFYPENGLPIQNQITGSFNRGSVMTPIYGVADSSFFSRIFRLREPDRRFQRPRNLVEPEDEIVIGDFASYTGSRLPEIEGLEVPLSVNSAPLMQLVWRGIEPAVLDYNIYVHLIDEDGTLYAAWDAPPLPNEFTYYSTRLWEPDEYIITEHSLPLTPDTMVVDDIPPGEYQLRIGLYDFFAEDRPRLPIMNGEVMSDGYTLPYRLTITVPVAR
jgi:hypothetical protein